MGVNSLPKTVTIQRRDCDLNPGHSAPESSTLTTRLPIHPRMYGMGILLYVVQYAYTDRAMVVCMEFRDALVSSYAGRIHIGKRNASVESLPVCPVGHTLKVTRQAAAPNCMRTTFKSSLYFMLAQVTAMALCLSV